MWEKNKNPLSCLRRQRRKERKPSSHVLNMVLLKCLLLPISGPPGYENIIHRLFSLTIWLLKHFSLPLSTNHMDAPCWLAFHSYVQSVTASPPTLCLTWQLQELPYPFQSLTLKIATARFAEVLENPQHSMLSSPETRSHTLLVRLIFSEFFILCNDTYHTSSVMNIYLSFTSQL
jgi:hypothetical protein